MSQYGEGEYPAVSDIGTRKANRAHVCTACHETIAPGHTYTREFLICEGAPYIYKRCARCQAIFVHLSGRMTDSDEYCDPDLACGHDYEDCWREPPPEAIAALAFWLPGDPLPTTEPR